MFTRHRTIVLLLCITSIYGYVQKQKIPKLFKIVDTKDDVLLKEVENPENLDEVLKHISKLENRQTNKNEPKNPGVIQSVDVFTADSFENAPKGKNRVLIKRIVPQSYLPPDIQYDYKYNTYYRPLVRIHKKKYNDIDDIKTKNPEITQMLFLKKNADKKKYQNIDRNNFDKEYLLQPFELGRLGKRGQVTKLLLDDIVYLLSLIKPGDIKKKSLKKLLEVLYDMDTSLRSIAIEEPVVPVADYDEQPVDEKPIPLYPHYALWNYWTYKKSIHHDECPENQVKIGNVCAWVPPH